MMLAKDKSTTLSNNSKAVKLIIKQKWDSLHRFLRTKEGMHQLTLVDPFGLSLLSICVAHNPPIELVIQMVHSNPMLTSIRDDGGLTPLHMACRCGASSAIVSLLIQNGAVPTIIDNKGKTPLHHVVEFLCDPLEVIENDRIAANDSNLDSAYAERAFVLTKKRKEKKITRDNISGNTLMSITVDDFQDLLHTIKILLFCNPKLIVWPDLEGNTPIDVVQECKACNGGDEGPKWERADIVYRTLREILISLYRRDKAIWEGQGTSCTDTLADSMDELSIGSEGSQTQETNPSTDDTSDSGTRNSGSLFQVSNAGVESRGDS
ncbi:hypothetical protein CTEN210_14655 [Chaetoceros tenuissimus]|uniref:Uncharacterized protein n=1 Tax=Chaetoceros tenuissimus TaxID=426638 RepID=A0AAD3D5J7_9STRA|nr:hypothetical protein CTEN210_14655 [Chaetoceros tenuissimus]